jgi:hypothetical protein
MKSFLSILLPNVLTLYDMSILWKRAVFVEKPPVTSSNCYETMNTFSILMKVGTKVDWTISFVKAWSILNFLSPWQCLKIAKKITILHCSFFHQNRFQSAATPQCNEIELKAFQRWFHFDGGCAENNVNFFNNISQTKNSVCGLHCK